MVTFGEAIGLAYRNSFDFKGYATRSEYWWFVLFTVLVNTGAWAVALVVPPVALVTIIFAVVTFPASLALYFRRIRDAGGSIILIFASVASSLYMGYASYGYQMDMAQSMIEATETGTRGVFPQLPPVPLDLTIAGVISGILGLILFIYTLLPSRD